LKKYININNIKLKIILNVFTSVLYFELFINIFKKKIAKQVDLQSCDLLIQFWQIKEEKSKKKKEKKCP
jgi:hypothetical protein